MKKGLSAAFIVVILLLLSTYFMGEKVQKETKKFFTQQSEKGISYKLINYDKGFFASRLKSEITVQVDSGPGVTFIIDTLIKHYPYKATLSSQVKFTSAMLNKKAKQYFSTSQWLSSEMQVSLLGTVTGDVNIVSGAYKSEQEKFSNKALSFNYSLNLSDYSGAFTLDLAYFNAESNSLTIQLENLFLSSHFNTLSIRESSQYLFRVQDIRSKIKNGNFHIKDFLIKGDSKASKDGLNNLCR
ncbi:DUF945 family protein [Psychromonas sp. CD1]|uniref:DUF945 family protein n=1 Tax=Psychromonas sp. CD1 TaxID=1979839 RepID=UPI0015DACF46|nr:DUF945 family protein [Psychromonas sp. CD1]